MPADHCEMLGWNGQRCVQPPAWIAHMVDTHVTICDIHVRALRDLPGVYCEPLP